MAGDESTVAFEVLSNETRVEILRSLADAFAESPTDPFLDYSELRAAVGMRDKGNFNYHLDRLDDLVVDGPEGYAVSSIGLEVVSALASGSLDPDWTWGPVDAPGACFSCGDSLALRYENGHLLLTCGTNEHALLFPVAPRLLDSTTDARGDVVERVAVSSYRQVLQLRHGICPECQGAVTPEIAPEPKPDQGGYYFHGDCQGCGFQHGYPVGAAVLTHPDVVAAYSQRGVDVRTTPFWTLEWCHVGHETVVSADPLRVRVDVQLDGETLSLTLDSGATVVSTERSETARSKRSETE